ncbi:helix-turn-helix domain-containing protein [Faecalimonas umbilicata]|uniref:helix-turn-helix domain-containing protein n=1 Tax=Faecalimonas umbilicata TaxID=1912855 RepID=UPI0022E5AFC9|nr:cupin domain-containing protein [Faecalimonas umbilicata]
MSKLNLTRIGFLLKNRRVESGLSIRELSIKSGVAAGTISQIETGKTSPNLVSVYSLCETLNFPISALFIQDDTDRVKLVRKNERTSFVRNTSNGESIVESLVTKGESRMWGGIIDMPAGTNSGDYYYHGGEEFVFMLEGSITFSLDQVGNYILETGDTLYYPNEIGHRWENHTKEPAKFLIVSTSEFRQDTEEDSK